MVVRWSDGAAAETVRKVQQLHPPGKALCVPGLSDLAAATGIEFTDQPALRRLDEDGIVVHQVVIQTKRPGTVGAGRTGNQILLGSGGTDHHLSL